MPPAVETCAPNSMGASYRRAPRLHRYDDGVPEQVKVRFPPSPTGLLHVGSARTALYNWLVARHTGGSLVLRFEDTDAARSTEEAIDQALRVLTWLGIDWDEGPYRQTDRYPLYTACADRLLDEGKAYRCYCTP